MEHKIFPTASTKVINEVQGIVEHVITVFGVLDLVKDISHPGSWTKTLAERGDKLLVLDMHNTDSINRAIGTPVSVREVGRNELPSEVLADYPEATGGVVAQTQMLMDTPEGKGAYIRLRDGAVREWSYGYDALDVDRSTVKNKEGDDVDVRNLRTVRVYEYGPVLWGACPGTMVTDVKEGKPAPDVTENTIRIRVREPGDFQEDSFRTITIGDEGDGIQAVIGRLEGETTTTVQSYVFDKEEFTTAEAQAWVDEHEKQVIPVGSKGPIGLSSSHGGPIGLPLPVGEEEKTVSEAESGTEAETGEGESEREDVLPQTEGKEIVDGKPKQRLGDVLQGSIHRVFTLLTDTWYVNGYLDREQRIQLSSLIGDALGVLAQGIPEEIANLETWDYAVMGLRIDNETKTDDDEKAVDLTQYVADVRAAFEAQYNPTNDPWRYWVMSVYDEYVIVQYDADDGREFYQIGYVRTEDETAFTPQGEWIGGTYVFVPVGIEGEELAKSADCIPDIREAFEGQHDTLDGPWDWVGGVYDEHVIVQREGSAEFHRVAYTKAENDKFVFAPRGEWISGKNIFVPHSTEDKAGRVLAGRNETRIITALLTLIDVLDDAGIELPGFEKNPVIVVPEEEASAPAVKQAASDDKEAGPIDDESPTLTELVRREEIKNLADWLEEQLATLSKEA